MEACRQALDARDLGSASTAKGMFTLYHTVSHASRHGCVMYLGMSESKGAQRAPAGAAQRGASEGRSITCGVTLLHCTLHAVASWAAVSPSIPGSIARTGTGTSLGRSAARLEQRQQPSRGVLLPHPLAVRKVPKGVRLELRPTSVVEITPAARERALHQRHGLKDRQERGRRGQQQQQRMAAAPRRTIAVGCATSHGLALGPQRPRQGCLSPPSQRAWSR